MDKPDSESVKHADRATNGGRPRVYERATIPSPRIIKFERGSTIVGRRPAETHHPSKPPSKPTLSGLQSPNHVEGSSPQKISRPDKPNSAAQPTSDPAGGPS